MQQIHFISNGALQFMDYQCICGSGHLRVRLALPGFICTALKLQKNSIQFGRSASVASLAL